MSKNNKEFQEFLRDEVNINPSRLDRLHTSVRAVSGYLKDNMKGYQKGEPQGSLALETIVRPVDDNDEYDADIQVVMNPNPDWQPRDYIKAVYDTLKENKTYADKLRLKTRCVTVDYAGDFHLDVVPRITVNGKHYILNRGDNKRERTDGNGYRNWFNDKNRITGGNLKKVVPAAQVPQGPQEQLHRQVNSSNHARGNDDQEIRQGNEGGQHRFRHAGYRPDQNGRLPAEASGDARNQEPRSAE